MKLIGLLALCVFSAPVWLTGSNQREDGSRAGRAGGTESAATRPEAVSSQAAAPLPATGLDSRSLLAPASPASPASLPASGTIVPATPAPPGQVSLSFLAGQVVMAGMDGTQPDAELLREARGGEIGGVLLFGSNLSPALPAAMATLQQAARQGAGSPLLIATDQEGGTVKRLPGPPESPQLMDSEATAQRQGADTASLLTASHVNVDLAPVADVVSPGGFEAGQGRGFAGSPDRVGALASAFTAGLQRGHVAATAKHFPGIGSLTLDTDHTLGQLQLSQTALQDQLVPFRKLVDSGVDLVMLANAVCPILDATHPAVFSRAVVGLLRQQLGFRGVVITDDLGVSSLPGDLGERAVEAVEAGADIVLFGSAAGGRAAYRALLAAVESGRLSGSRLEDSYRRIQALRTGLAS
jgi:beta-N-acetylhexosaminidase